MYTVSVAAACSGVAFVCSPAQAAVTATLLNMNIRSLILIMSLGGIVTLIVLGRKGPHGFPFRRPHSHFPIH